MSRRGLVEKCRQPGQDGQIDVQPDLEQPTHTKDQHGPPAFSILRTPARRDVSIEATKVAFSHDKSKVDEGVFKPGESVIHVHCHGDGTGLSS